MRTHIANRYTRRSATRAVLPFVFVLAACGSDSEAREGGEGEEGRADAAQARGDATAQTAVPAIPAGTQLVFEVQEDVSTASHRSGDSFRLRLVDPASGSHGAGLSAGVEARGIVTESKQSSGPDDEALLGLKITTLAVNGSQTPIETRVDSATLETSAGDSSERTAAKIATGAAAGAIIGQILGRDTRSTVVGAAVGAVAGTGIALTTRTGNAVLPRGSRVTVTLTEPLRMP